MHERRRRDRPPSFLLINLFIQIASQLERLPNKPPVTVFFLFVNIYVHIAPYVSFMGYDLTDVSGNCLQPQKVVSSFFNRRNIQLHRMLFSSLIHVDDVHLYYNMLSLCWKGINLETRLGSTKFLQLVMFSLLVCPVIMVALTYGLDQIGFGPSASGYHACAVGFSGVLFSLKYVWNQIAHEGTNILGINIPGKYAAWAELIFASLISPNVSFMGHLSGILTGMLYLHGMDWLCSTSLGRSLVTALAGLISDNAHTSGWPSSRNTYGSGTLGGNSSTSSNSARGSANHGNLRNRTTGETRRRSQPPNSGAEFELETSEEVYESESKSVPSNEELRQQRSKRFYL